MKMNKFNEDIWRQIQADNEFVTYMDLPAKVWAVYGQFFGAGVAGGGGKSLSGTFVSEKLAKDFKMPTANWKKVIKEVDIYELALMNEKAKGRYGEVT